MDVDRVAGALVRPAAGVVDQARRIVALRPGRDPLRVVLPPSLVERHPHDDRRVVPEGVHDGLPLALELGVANGQVVRGHGLSLIEGARHVLPDQQAEPVAPGVEAVGLDLDVLAEHVQAQALDGLEVVPQGRVGRGRVEAVGPPALVEGPELEEGLAVEEEAIEPVAVLGDGDLPQPGVARDGVDLPALPGQGDLDVEEGRIVRGPQRGPVQSDHGGHGRRAAGRAGRRPVPLDGHGERQPGRIADDPGPEGQGPGADVGGDIEAGDVGLGHGLHPDRLPDAGHGRIEDAVRLHDLLAAGDAAVVFVGRVPDAQDDLLPAAPLEETGHVVGERVVAAPVGPGLAAVDPDRALPVDGAEMEQDPARAPGLGHVDGPPVPEGVADADGLADAREGRFDREGHQDLPVPRRGPPGVPGRDGVVPQTVEAGPLGPDELGPGVFGQDALRTDLGRPAGGDAVSRRLPGRGRLGPAGGGEGDEDGERQADGGSVHGGTPIGALVIHRPGPVNRSGD